jgi:hypothetical protein
LDRSCKDALIGVTEVVQQNTRTDQEEELLQQSDDGFTSVGFSGRRYGGLCRAKAPFSHPSTGAKTPEMAGSRHDSV